SDMLKNNVATQASIVIDVNIYAIFFLPIKSKFILVNQLRVIFVLNANLASLAAAESTKILVITIAVNNEVTIPINKVTANPLIGPEPKITNTIPVKAVVTLASTIADIAPLQENECFIASLAE